MRVFVLLSTLFLGINSACYSQNDTSILATSPEFGSLIEVVKFSPKGNFIAVGGWDRNVSLWKADSTGLVTLSLNSEHQSTVTDINFSYKEDQLVSCSKDKSVITYSISQDGNLSLNKKLNHHTRTVNSAKFDITGNLVYSVSDDGKLYMQVLSKKSNYSGSIDAQATALEMFRNKTFFFVGDNTGRIHRLNKTMKPFDIFEDHNDEISELMLTPDQKKLISASFDKTIKIWDANSGKLINTLVGHEWKVNCIDISSDGKMAISGGMDGKVIIWDLEEGKIIKTFDQLGANIRAVSFNHKANMAVVGVQTNDDKNFMYLIKTGVSVPEPEKPKRKVLQQMPNSNKTKNAKPLKSKSIEKTEAKENNEKIIKETEEIKISVE